MSLGIENSVALKVFGLNVAKIIVSPLKAASSLSSSVSESTPKIRAVNGSFKLLFEE